MTESPTPDCAALLAHADWVRTLARHLTADAHAADDLAQDALAAALVRPPPADRPLGAWLTGVLRNLVRQQRRSAAHRAARERSAARSEADASQAELLERLDSHRAVVEAVARLDEPYRAVILLRYFEGLSPAAIARRTGTPHRTVHTRLARALVRLRAELDRTHGGERRTWLLALLPYARGAGGWTTAAAGVLVMETKFKLGAALVAVLGICSTLVLWRDDAGAGSPRTQAGPVELARPAERTPEHEGARAQVHAPVDRRALAPAPEATAAVVPPAAEPRLSGRVLDAEHAPVASVRVRFAARDGAVLEAVTDAGGAFALARPTSGGTLDVASPGWTSLFRPEFEAAPGAREVVLVVARSLALGGRVVDESGRALADVRVSVPLPFGLRTRFDAILDRASTVERQVTTGPDGRFELTDVPQLEGVELVSERPAHRTDRRALPAFDDLALEIVLARLPDDSSRLVGRVFDLNGEPVADAWVGLGRASVQSGPDGAFALELADAQPVGTLRAVKAGHLPAELTRAPGAAWPEPLELVLGPEPLAISGRVVDARGEPVPGAEVWTDEETHFGFVPLPGGELSVRVGASVEGLLRGDAWTPRARTDVEGRFALHGLLERDYRVRAFDRARLLLATATLAAGQREVELRLPDEELRPRVAGRVTDLGGAPLVGAEVVLARAPLGGGPAGELESHATRTDADGRFAFERVTRAVEAVAVRGPELGLIGFRRALDAHADLERLELAVPMRVHVQIDSGASADFDRVALLDAEGQRLTLALHHGEHSYAMEEIELERGRSEAFSVSELATTLVLLSQGAEVRRVPVRLVRGERNTLRP